MKSIPQAVGYRVTKQIMTAIRVASQWHSSYLFHVVVFLGELTLVESYNIEPLQNPLSATKSFQFTIAQKK